jgi:hypothetical protein
LNQPLEVRLVNNAGVQAIWDDVRLYHQDYQIIPEPSACALALLGLAGAMLGLGRRKRRGAACPDGP